jgi:hypothetical protein
MSEPATLDTHRAIIEVEVRPSACVITNCGGAVVRHSLGGGQAVDRCVRCFRRYRLVPPADPRTASSKLRRFVDEFVSWRE